MPSVANNLSRRNALALGAGLSIAAMSRAFAQQKEPFTIGVALPTTGSAAPFGIDDAQALEWGVADVNAKGGPGSRVLQTRLFDTQANPQIGIDVVSRMLSVDKLQLVSVSFSAVVAATAPIVNRNKALMLSTGATSPRIAQMGEYVFTSYPLANVDATMLAKYARDRLKADRAAVLYINDESGVYASRIYRETFENLGGKIVAFESYEPNATDYTGAVLKVRASDPQVVHLQGNAGDSPQAIRQLRQLGLATPITSYAAAYSPQLVKQVGPQADGLIVATFAPSPEESPAVAAFAERWIKEKGRPSGNLPVHLYFYDVAFIVKALVERLDQAGEPLTGDNLKDALLAIGTFDLPMTGPVTFTPDHNIRKPVYIQEVKNGVYVPMGRYE
jgi:branched-chain amino acid transport system substrate-binding protein